MRQNIKGVRMPKPATLSLAPQYLKQPIEVLNGFQPTGTFNFFTVNLGSTSNPDVEREALDVVGSYGRQIGHIQEALDVLLKHVPMSKLSAAEKETIKVLKRDISSVRQIKRKHGE